MGELVALKQPEDVRFARPADLAELRCSDEALFEAVGLWLLGERYEVVAQCVGVSVDGLRRYLNKPGWKRLAGLMRDGLAEAAHAKITRLVSKALGELEERLEEGDPVYNDKGVLVGYSPIRARDLVGVVGVLVDRQHAIEKRAAGATSPEDNISLRDLLVALKRKAQEIELAP